MNPSPRHRFLVQAPVPAVDADGVGVVASGTIIWALAAGVLWLNFGALSERGHQWWLWVAVSGFGLGVLGLIYSLGRARRRSGPPGAQPVRDRSVEEGLVDGDAVPQGGSGFASAIGGQHVGVTAAAVVEGDDPSVSG